MVVTRVLFPVDGLFFFDKKSVVHGLNVVCDIPHTVLMRMRRSLYSYLTFLAPVPKSSHMVHILSEMIHLILCSLLCLAVYSATVYSASILWFLCSASLL